MDLIVLFAMAMPLCGLGFFGWLAVRYVRARELDAANRMSMAPRSDAVNGELIASLQSEIHALRERVEFVETLLERPRSTPNLRP